MNTKSPTKERFSLIPFLWGFFMISLIFFLRFHEADDVRAVIIATSTNLIQRQNLSIVEPGKAYKALLEAKNRNGQKNASSETFGEIRRRYDVRKNATEHEIRKAVKLTSLIPELLEILENSPRRLNLSCVELMADYDANTQSTFIPMCETEGRRLSVGAMKRIVRQCLPPAASKPRGTKQKRKQISPPQSNQITFERKKVCTVP